MQFEYLYQMQATGTLDIEDIGNFALSLTNDLYQEYILIVKTEQGQTKVIQYGPRWIDFDKPATCMNYTYNEFQFNMNKIRGIVDKMLNGSTLCTQATIIPEDDAVTRIKDLVNFL